jgi:hypothetical protein
VGPGVRQEQIRLGAREITYEFTLTGVVASQVDLVKIREAIRTPLIAAICVDKKLVRSLNHGVALQYVYRDKNGHTLAILSVMRENCDRATG